jgi:hypothetical protein
LAPCSVTQLKVNKTIPTKYSTYFIEFHGKGAKITTNCNFKKKNKHKFGIEV